MALDKAVAVRDERAQTISKLEGQLTDVQAELEASQASGDEVAARLAEEQATAEAQARDEARRNQEQERSGRKAEARRAQAARGAAGRHRRCAARSARRAPFRRSSCLPAMHGAHSIRTMHTMQTIHIMHIMHTNHNGQTVKK